MTAAEAIEEPSVPTSKNPVVRSESPSLLLRLFSNHSKQQQQSEQEEPTTRSSEDSSGEFPSVEPHESILKYKTQQESLSQVYPKPFVCAQCCHCASDKKRVRFGSVTIQSYPTILSDHPCTLLGPPVGLGWEVVCVQHSTVDQHFAGHPSWRGRNPPRNFYLSQWTRERMLLARGYSQTQLRSAVQEGKTIRASRAKNAQPYPNWMYPVLVHLFGGPVAVDVNNNRTRAVAPQKALNTTKTPQKKLTTQAEVLQWMKSTPPSQL